MKLWHRKVKQQPANVIPLDKWRRGRAFRRLMRPVNPWLKVEINPPERK